MMMQNFSQLIYSDFDLKNITVTPCIFEAGDRVEYKHGRKNNLLHIVTFGTRYYHVNGREFEVDAGSIIFIPKGTKYITYTKDECRGTGVCFDMIGETDVALPPDVYTDWQIESSIVFLQVQKMEQVYFASPASVLAIKSMLFKILYLLAKGEKCSKNDYQLIKPAIDYIALHFTENLKTSEYAALCNMSDSYFRKKFTQCMGISPIQYRNELRFALARRLYSSGNTLHQIAELTGFYDAGFFSKAYKRHTGETLRRCNAGHEII